jgi:hypothetical protein
MMAHAIRAHAAVTTQRALSAACSMLMSQRPVRENHESHDADLENFARGKNCRCARAANIPAAF